jgi:hypothetical protein
MPQIKGVRKNAINKGMIVGWGITKSNNRAMSNRLRNANVKMLSESVCQENYTIFNSDKEMCAPGAVGMENPCQGIFQRFFLV